MNSNVKGAVAEQAIVLAATKLGVPVLRPVAEHGRTDLAFDISGNLLRVQVKWGRLSRSGDVVIVSVFTSRCTTRGHIRRTYTELEVDLFAVYCGDLDRCFLLPAQQLANTTSLHLRLTPPRNGQQSCINLAGDFEFNGAVAQLARAPAWHAGGRGFESPQLHSPAAPPDVATKVNADVFRTRLGHWIDRITAGEDVLVTRRGKPVMSLTAVPPASLPARSDAAHPSANGAVRPSLLPIPGASSA